MTTEPQALIEIQGVSRRFGATVANDDISWAITAGEIVGLVGENGAGKSTLLSILGGFDTPDSGGMRYEGQPVAFRSPRDAIALGIVLVHQHLSLVPTFTVLDQIRLAGGGPDQVPHGVDPEARIDTLAMGTRQRVEIARALAMNPRLLLLDEPTSILAPGEVDDLFVSLARLRDQGMAIIVVSHKLREVLALVDRAVVLSDGRVVDEVRRDAAGWPQGIEKRLVASMFGREVGTSIQSLGIDSTPGDAPVLRLSGFSVPGAPGAPGDTVVDVTAEFPGGRLIGIVGIDGNGQRALAEGMAGYRSHTGELAFRRPGAAGRTMMPTISYLTGDRLGDGAIASMTTADNLRLKRRGWRRLHSETARAMLEDASVRPPDPSAPLGALSGGNIQRTLIAREFLERPEVLVADNPVHGLDRQSADRIWSELRAFALAGGIVIALLADLDDALASCDEIAVLTGGRLSTLIPRVEFDRAALGHLMVGG